MRSINTTHSMTVVPPSRFDFDKIADRYDRWFHTTRGIIYDRLEKKAMDGLLAGYSGGNKLLEVGCGTAHWSEFFSDRGFEVTGIDISGSMIDVAKSKNIAHASFQVADGHSMPFADNSFDIVAAITTLEFATDAEAMIAEMVRCVRKPAGVLLLGVLNALSDYNQERKDKPDSAYASARLFSPEQLRELLEPLGHVQMTIAGFVPRHRWLFAFAPIFEFSSQLVNSQHGAFIAARVEL
jgi:ubiquinone/menaquinone biosynthesis C-methylase UbiE